MSDKIGSRLVLSVYFLVLFSRVQKHASSVQVNRVATSKKNWLRTFLDNV